MAVGDCSVTERRRWRPPYQTGKTVHAHAKHYKHNEDGRTAPGGCQWFRTAEPLGERRYENWNTHTHIRFTDVSLPCDFAPGDFAHSLWRLRYPVFFAPFQPKTFRDLVFFFSSLLVSFQSYYLEKKKLIFKNWFEDEFQIDVEFYVRKNILIDFSSSVYYWRKSSLMDRWWLNYICHQVNENSNRV